MAGEADVDCEILETEDLLVVAEDGVGDGWMEGLDFLDSFGAGSDEDTLDRLIGRCHPFIAVSS